MTKASEIIKTQCCGNMLDIPKCDLIAKVEKLENALSHAHQLAQDSVEININNFNIDDVERLNNEMIDLYEFLEGIQEK